MKDKFLYILIICSVSLLTTLIFTSCGSVATQTGGYEDKATIMVVAEKPYINQVMTVFVDGALLGDTGKLVAVKNATRKAKRLTVAPGTHTVEVRNVDGISMYKAKVFLSTGKNKMIIITQNN